MSKIKLEHVNITVKDPDATAKWMADVFGWHLRWSGDSLAGGRNYHVGTDDQYIALYRPPSAPCEGQNSYGAIGGLNHIAVVVDDINEVEGKVKTAGFTPYNHGDYEPGLRFYFHDHDGIEYEVVSYS